MFKKRQSTRTALIKKKKKKFSAKFVVALFVVLFYKHQFVWDKDKVPNSDLD